MASSALAFDQDHPPNPASSDDPLQFLIHHGFFYKNNAEIGKEVDDLYKSKRAHETGLAHFERKIKEDTLKMLLDEYPIEMHNFSRPWGKTLTPYKWIKNSNPRSKDRIIAYILGPKPRYYCWAGSHKSEHDGTVDAFGTRRIPEDSLESYLKTSPDMEDGGVLFVHGLFVHKAEGSAIMVVLVKSPESASESLE